VTETDNYPSVRVYPNPTEGKLQFTTYNLQFTNIEVFDVFGRKVSNLTSQISNLFFDITHLPQGMYFVRITTKEGVVTKKIIKQ
jgi:hypothetical protein